MTTSTLVPVFAALGDETRWSILAALGEGDAVMLGGQTRRRLGPEFAPEDLGETELRNIDEPVRVFRLRPPPEEASARAVPAAGRRD